MTPICNFVLGTLVAVLLASGSSPAAAQDRVHASDVLANYVAKSDQSYAWRIYARYRQRGADIIELRLHSQTWREVLWQHQLFIIKPRAVSTGSHGMLIVGGGRWRDEYDVEPAAVALPDEAERFIALARRLQTVVAVLGQVPYQPLLGRTEDRLIAYTLDQFLRTGDAEWPLLLPMVKSAVRAMDATQEAASAEWDQRLDSFTILGGSKRGWTSWLAAAVDRRITALAPVVIDVLNMEQHFGHQVEVWGAPSEEISPYTELDLHNVLSSEEGRALREIVDPFSYRAMITQPKLIVIATNDRYFPIDALNLYWGELSGPNYILYLPNDGHSIEDYDRLIPSLRALHESVASDDVLPRLDWEYRWQREVLALCVRSDPPPATVRTWTAASGNRDFRDAEWVAAPARGREDSYVFEIARPTSGYAAVFSEATFGRGRAAYSLSTNLAVVGPATTVDDAPWPVGQPGVCAAAGRP